jgi:DNA repair protein RecN (Recombination protein N)
MLTHLVIRNFAIIEHLEIPFNVGFTVLTGETGAGKSIVIDALNLLLGGRASTEVIRTDEDKAIVEGIFEPKASVLERVNAELEDRGIMTSDDQLVVRRIVSRSGRNKVFVNGSLTTVSALAELMKGLVDISGQHEHYSLLDPEGHVDILDNFAGLGREREQMGEAWGKVADLRGQLSAIRKGARDRVNRMDYLRFQLEEIEGAGLKVHEEAELEAELGVLKHAEKLQDAGRRALALAYEGNNSAAQQLSEAVGALGRVVEYDAEIGALAERFEEAQILAEEAARDLRARMFVVDANPARLDALIARSETIKRLKRKHGADIAEILSNARAMRQELDRLENHEEHSEHLERALAEAERAAFEVARRLSMARRTAAARLERALEEQLADLNMARTTFVADFALPVCPGADDWSLEERPFTLGPRGLDAIEFLLSPNVGEAPKPLSKIASGGELSRIMLVMKSALAERDEVSTYVFDEVDTGIGGSTADMVGIKIERTAAAHQVLCITHLPQIASRADNHYLVEKLLVDGRTQSTIRPLASSERVEEIARMLGGTRVTDTTLRAARELVA